MNAAFHQVIGAKDAERLEVFLASARRLGTAVQNIEKDFWVCWVLDVLFNGIGERQPRLLFKGGTSLSKSFGLIDRFSEDIDITVFRADLGEPASIDELEALSGKKRRARLDAIRVACQLFINGPFLKTFNEVVTGVMGSARVAPARYRAEPDPADTDQQTVLFWYPVVTAGASPYIRSAVKIEAGAKSALDPHVLTTVKPYAADDVAALDLQVTGITTVEPQRTFWDKIVILHGLRAWHGRRGQLRHGGQRVSRHYFDVFRMLQSTLGERAMADRTLGADCARHARMFFNSPDFELDRAVAGTFRLEPPPDMRVLLERDYDAMTMMITGAVPPFADVMNAMGALERRINAAR
jgi:hypothetical protein